MTDSSPSYRIPSFRYTVIVIITLIIIRDIVDDKHTVWYWKSTDHHIIQPSAKIPDMELIE